MTIQQLEYIIALDTYRHFVTAAEKCFVTQPTITLQVKKLEEEIGIQIFDRTKTPLEPTSMGELIIAKARGIIMEVEQLKEMVNKERDDLKGTFRIGIIPTISPYIVPRFIGSFIEHYPDTVLDIEEMKSEDIIVALKKGTLDVGILVTPLDESSLREIPLYNEPFVYYSNEDKDENANVNDRISAGDVEKKSGLWLLSSGHCFGEQVLNICNSPEDTNHIHFRSGSIETLMKMVDNYGGFTLIPAIVADDVAPGKIRYFLDPQPIREVSLVVHKGFVKEQLLIGLRKEILSVVPKSFEKNERYFKVKWR